MFPKKQCGQCLLFSKGCLISVIVTTAERAIILWDSVCHLIYTFSYIHTYSYIIFYLYLFLIYLYIFVFIYLYVYLSIYLSIYLYLCLPVLISISHQFILSLCFCLSSYLSNYPIYLRFCLFIYIYLSILLHLCLSWMHVISASPLIENLIQFLFFKPRLYESWLGAETFETT